MSIGAIYNNAPPINVIVHSIKEQASWAWYTYNYIVFIDKANKKTLSYWDEGKDGEELFLFSTRKEAVKFYKDKNNLN